LFKDSGSQPDSITN